ncbi:MAG: competence/damage-inducible protein A [Lachnospiraceae bacterium]|nr:competence/damage-inducible protein A [Lachnospiraceae bacterium]
MVAEIICVGTELLMGNTVNTNAAFLARGLADLGISVYYQTVVGDNVSRLTDAVHTALDRSDIIITSGGLGPTEDDLTKETVCAAMGIELIEDPHTRQRIEEFFKRFRKGRIVTDNNWKQAMIPKEGFAIDNDNGTAPGIVCEKGEKRAILLPGPPHELKAMFTDKVVPYLAKLQPDRLYSRMIKIAGVGESNVETRILDLIDNQTNPTIAPYAKMGEVHLRITAKASSEEEGMALIEPVAAELRKRFGKAIFTEEESETLEDVVIGMLRERGFSIATAESCTGGLISGRLINVPGASDVLNESYVTYSNEAKERLVGVSHETLLAHGAVSEETAAEMAKGAALAANAEVGLSATGIAGPGGGRPDKPVGLVYIGCSVKGKTEVRRFEFRGSRENNRSHTVQCALILLRDMLLFTVDCI